MNMALAPQRGDATGLARPRLIIAADDYERLQSLARQTMYRLPDVAHQLLEEVERAEIRQPDQVPPTVVAIGSKVSFRNETSGRDQTVRLVYPADADIGARRISVLTPIGAALIGMNEGDSIDWESRDGIVRRLTVTRVQP
ncbi:nucleoside diphosphate kinase regulator [Desertibaculum subflavum]|uniref:nucleoside diphosphate kinase regulator n=1 Tax=Desertibaculum subflavum TaxID=2268458 RepID=UPI000E66BCCE